MASQMQAFNFTLQLYNLMPFQNKTPQHINVQNDPTKRSFQIEFQIQISSELHHLVSRLNMFDRNLLPVQVDFQFF